VTAKAALPDNSARPADRAARRARRQAHHGRGSGVWLVTFRMNALQSM
jgi:hypothetical protein